MLRKIFLVISLLAALFMLTACGEKKVQVTGTLEELMTKVYSNLPEDKTPMALGNIEVTKENVKDYLGTDDIEFTEALASESQVGSIAHSVVLVRVDENADFEAIKTKIKENVNPRKWICVGVDEGNVIVKNKGNLIILIMTNDGKEELEKGFDSL